MKLLITGLNHRTAPVEVREKIAFNEAASPCALDRLRRQPGFLEGMILSTCNRVEIAVTAEENIDLQKSIESSSRSRRSLARLDRALSVPLRRIGRDPSSVPRGFQPGLHGGRRTADSRPAEVRLRTAKEAARVNGYLDMVVSRAFNVAKRVRTETEIGQSAVSVSYAAVELAREFSVRSTAQGAADRRGQDVGACRAASPPRGVGDIFVTNRTRSRAEEMAEVFERPHRRVRRASLRASRGGHRNHLQRRAALHPGEGPDEAGHRSRRNRPMFLIDIAVPRNIEPAVNELDNVFLYDIDDLQKVVERNIGGA